MMLVHASSGRQHDDLCVALGRAARPAEDAQTPAASRLAVSS
jgi:hypothetical protein